MFQEHNSPWRWLNLYSCPWWYLPPTVGSSPGNTAPRPTLFPSWLVPHYSKHTPTFCPCSLAAAFRRELISPKPKRLGRKQKIQSWNPDAEVYFFFKLFSNFAFWLLSRIKTRKVLIYKAFLKVDFVGKDAIRVTKSKRSGVQISVRRFHFFFNYSLIPHFIFSVE